jgi:peroxiredoxin
MLFTRLALVLGSALLLGVAPMPPAKKKVVIGQPAPEFVLRTYAHENISLSSLRGQVVVLNLWATWCVPCKTEMPMMDSYYRQYSGKGLRIFAVATEDSVPPYKLKALSAALSFPLVLQLRGGAYDVLDGVPTNFIIDRNGIVRYAKADAFDRAEFDAVLKPLLAEPAPPPLP